MLKKEKNKQTATIPLQFQGFLFPFYSPSCNFVLYNLQAICTANNFHRIICINNITKYDQKFCCFFCVCMCILCILMKREEKKSASICNFAFYFKLLNATSKCKHHSSYMYVLHAYFVVVIKVSLYFLFFDFDILWIEPR